MIESLVSYWSVSCCEVVFCVLKVLHCRVCRQKASQPWSPLVQMVQLYLMDFSLILPQCPWRLVLY